jgi:hypothetical protein
MIVGSVATICLFAAAAFAHHSFAATYILKDTIEVEGNVTRLLIRNPHSMLEIESPDDKGKMQVWIIEWAAGNQLAQSPWTKTLKPGDPVVAVGNPARAEGWRKMRLTSLKRKTDGLEWGRRPGEVVD